MVDPQPKVQALVVAYLCEPGRGSERGAGWGMVKALDEFSDCTLLTSPESGAVIDAWRTRNPDSTIRAITVGESRWASALKRHRIGEFLVYLAWQRRVRDVAHDLMKKQDFDVAIHATLSAFWLPSVAVDMGVPSVWGPVGGAVTTPWKLWRLLGWKGAVVEVVDWLAVRTMSLMPSTRRTWKNATIRIVQNDETLDRLSNGAGRTTVLNHALFHNIPILDSPDHRGDSDPYAVWLSPMESRKGPELAVRAVALTRSTIRMIMVGDGPERRRIEQIARELGVFDRIEFTGMVPHQRALELLSGARVAIFTGMREEGGLALAEAMYLGTSVVVLANGGAATIARSATDPHRVTLVQPVGVQSTIAAMAEAIEYQMQQSSERSSRPGPLIDKSAAVAALSTLVSDAVGTGSEGGH